MFQRPPIVQIVSQVLIDLPSDNPEQMLHYCRHEALKWAQRRAGTKLPAGAWKGDSFDLIDLNNQPVSATSLEGFWAARIDDADKSVAQRTWMTEIGIRINRHDKNRVTFGCRLYCRALGENPTFAPTIPAVVRRIVDTQFATVDGRHLKSSAWWIHDRKAVDELVAFLLQPKRERSVIVVAAPPAGDPPALRVHELAKSLIGTAHVAYITEEASYLLSDAVGRGFSVFGGAVRTYRTGFFPDADQPTMHPRALYDRIVDWPGEDPSFQHFLVKTTMKTYLSSRSLFTDLPTFASIRSEAAERERERLREQGATDSELLESADYEIDKLRQQLQEEKDTYENLLSIAENEKAQIQKDLNKSQQAKYSLQVRVDGLEASLANTGNKEDVEIPDNLDDILDWCDKYIGDRVLLLGRAYKELGNSQFEDIELIYKSLLLLHNHYVPTRRFGGMELKNAYQEACQKLGLEEAESISLNRAGEEKDTYFVNYDGNRRLLDRHLKKGNTRDPRYCFRLYFFWDEEEEQVVVGWLPSHLDIRST